MGAKDRKDDTRIGNTLEERARVFSFFQLVRLLENSVRSAARVGSAAPAVAEQFRFRPNTSLGFPASDVVSIEHTPASFDRPSRLRITTSFLGLYGSTSPLPICYSEEILQEDPDCARVRDFLDIFHHRLISLLYRCWSKYRYPIEFEHGKDDPITTRLFAIIGLGSPALVQAAGISDPWRLLHFAGLFHHQPHCAANLERILTDYFDGLPVEVEQCTGSWVAIRKEQSSSLGRKNCSLGVDCSIGKQVFSRMVSFRIWIGPCEYDRMLDFLPDQNEYDALRRIVDLFVNSHLNFDIGFRVRNLPLMQVASEGSSRRAPRLGWNTWLFSDVPGVDTQRAVVFGGFAGSRSKGPTVV